MSRSPVEERNRAATERLRSTAERLSDEDMSQLIDPPWTPAALFAHVAFWDRFVHGRWLLASKMGSRTPLQFESALLELVNNASLRQWATVPPRAAVQECLSAAIDLDALIGSLDADALTEVVREGREGLIDRSIHRGEHLRTIETALGMK
jgi:hypothetical protein